MDSPNFVGFILSSTRIALHDTYAGVNSILSINIFLLEYL